MLYRTLLILLLSMIAINPVISAAEAPVAAHPQMKCHDSLSGVDRFDLNNCDNNRSECCDSELSDCCLQFSAVLFIMPAGLQRFALQMVLPGWVPPAYLSAIPPPVYHPPRSVLLFV